MDLMWTKSKDASGKGSGFVKLRKSQVQRLGLIGAQSNNLQIPVDPLYASFQCVVIKVFEIHMNWDDVKPDESRVL